LVFFLYPFSSAAAGAIESPKPATNSLGISLTIRCTNDVYKAGDEIPVEFVISNGGPTEYIDMYQMSDRRGLTRKYALVARIDSGKQVRDPFPFHGGGGAEAVAFAHLTPGQSDTVTMPLNLWAAIESPGKYVVSGSYFCQPCDFDNGHGPIYSRPFEVAKSETITVTILPRTDKEMDDYIGSLTNQLAALAPERNSEDLIKKLMYTRSPKVIPAVLRAMFADDNRGSWEYLALVDFVPHTDETRKTLLEAANHYRLSLAMAEVLCQFGFPKEQIRPLIRAALTSEHPDEWHGGVILAMSYPDDAFTARLIAIAQTAGSNARAEAIRALAFNRTDSGVKALKTLMDDPDPQILGELATAVGIAYDSSTNASVRPMPQGDFTAQELKPLIEKLLASQDSEKTWALNLIKVFGDDGTFTERLVTMAESRGSNRSQAMYALAFNRTDEGVKVLKALLDNGDKMTRTAAEWAIRDAYTSRRAARGIPLRPDDFDAKFQQIEAAPAAGAF
jgi:HEAT repeat protein